MPRKYEKAISKLCKFCKKEFTRRPSQKQIYCSIKCKNEDIKSKRIVFNCDNCGIEYHLKKSRSNSSKHYCSRNCMDSRRSDNSKKISRDTNFYKALIQDSECTCGVTENYLLQIHHRDGNKRNQTLDNLEVVCANCHIKRHLNINKDGELGYNSQILTSKEIQEKLTYETITSVPEHI